MRNGKGGKRVREKERKDSEIGRERKEREGKEKE